MKKILLLTIVFCTLNLHAQTNKEYEEFLKNRSSELQQYTQSRNEEFSKFLEERWKEFNAMQGMPVPSQPKPDIMPDAGNIKPTEPVKIEVEDIIIPESPKIEEKIQPSDPKNEEIIKQEEIQIDKKPISPNPEKPSQNRKEPEHKFEPTVTPAINKNVLNFSLYNTKLETPYVSTFNIRLKDIKEKSVSEFWDSLDRENLSEITGQLLKTKNEMQLNDWGFFNLCKETVNTIFKTNNSNEKTICGVYLLNQCGYEIKIARFEDRLIYLFPAEQQIFQQAYISLDNNKYYIFEHDKKSNQRYPSVFTYNFSFDKNASKFDLNINSPINIGNTNLNDKIANVNNEKLDITYSKNIIDYYKDYPRTELIVYFSAAVDESLSKSIKSQLGSMLQGKTELESVNFILKFINDNFKYKTDDDQFGYEKWFFCEENFYYPYGDCEDRSILFSWLVDELLNLDVVLLDYPNHIATAVHFNENVSGDYILVNGKKYIICDPTYFNAKAGMCMPQYKNQKATVISRKN
ncbi:MAG: hypothetical protein LBP67_02030 [Bacteroidales bacterium]|nr:hypothetical protein [Bacteroidales bacterium]